VPPDPRPVQHRSNDAFQRSGVVGQTVGRDRHARSGSVEMMLSSLRRSPSAQGELLNSRKYLTSLPYSEIVPQSSLPMWQAIRG
jgi:hypothetical protein